MKWDFRGLPHSDLLDRAARLRPGLVRRTYARRVGSSVHEGMVY